MVFKVNLDNTVGVVYTILIVFLLSQSKFFYFFVNTALGRSILILLILGITYIDKFFGIIVILFIIIFFNNSEIGYLEGFTNSYNTRETNVTKEQLDTKTHGKKNVKNEKNESIEGFNIVEREHMILKGKRSNEVPIHKNLSNQDDIESSDTSVFASIYSSV